jgi:hypothetical protein
VAEKRGATRRQIFKNWAGLVTGSVTTGMLSISTLVSLWGLGSYGRREQKVDSTSLVAAPLEEPKFHGFPIRSIDTKIGQVPVRLLGVKHTREFIQQHYAALEELVKDCCCAVFEVTPGLMSTNVFEDAKAYYGTLVGLCKRYEKPVVFMNPFSDMGEISEGVVGLFGVTYASRHSFKIISKNSTRRDFLTHGMKMAAGTYLFLGSPIISESPRWLLRDIPEFDENEDKLDKYFINHSFDQTNVEVANRLLFLSKNLTKDELGKGDYIFFSFGDRHAGEVDYYLRHPIVRGIKSGFYRLTYGLVDNDEVVKFVPGKNSWERIRMHYP